MTLRRLSFTSPAAPSDEWAARVATLRRNVTEANRSAADRAKKRNEFYDRIMQRHTASEIK